MPPEFSADAKSLLTQLLERDPTKRLGNFNQRQPPSIDDADSIRKHPFFKSINWAAVQKRTHKAKFVPKVKSQDDTSCIDELFTKEGLEETYIDPSDLDEIHFKGFSYDNNKKNLDQAANC